MDANVETTETISSVDSSAFDPEFDDSQSTESVPVRNSINVTPLKR